MTGGDPTHGERPLDHVGLAVTALAPAVARWEAWGAAPEGPAADLPEQGVRVRFLRLGASRLELLAPLADAGPVARFLARRGPGLHHLALRVPDVAAELAHLRAQGAPLIDEAPRRGHGGRRVAFVHPSWAQGTLVELVEAAGADGAAGP